MRKSYFVVFLGMLAVLAMVSTADAQKTYTWNLVEGASAHGIWPNEANAKNVFETDLGLLGRVVPGVLSNAVVNTCELAQSYTCAPGSPPAFLLNGNPAEGIQGAGAGSECNVKVVACNTVAIPTAGHEPADGDVAGIGEYSYLAIHTVGAVTDGKGIAFFSGSYTTIVDPLTCNTCPGLGRNKDAAGPAPSNAACTANQLPWACCTGSGTGTCITTQNSLLNTTGGARARASVVDLWTTQSTGGAGHSHITLKADGSLGAGEFPSNGSVNICGGGVVFQTLEVNLCGPAAPATFTIPNQKVTARTYSTNTSAWASFSGGGASERNCSGPDCYIQHHVIPAALALAPTARAVQMQTATSVLPATAGVVAFATVDSLLFAYTTQLLDSDSDGVEDAVDACPQDATNACLTNQACVSPLVSCADGNGRRRCVDAFLCNQRIDVDMTCTATIGDANQVVGKNSVGGLIPAGGAGGLLSGGFGASFFGPFNP